MKRWQRKALRRVAGLLIDLADGLRAQGDRLMTATERPARPEPLSFPSASELLLQDLLQRTLRARGDAIARDLFYGRWPLREGAIRVRDDGLATFVPIETMRKPANGD